MTMEFYQSINRYYDHIFPLNKMQVGFLREAVPSGNILDIGCATGSLALALDKEGYAVTAIDFDPGMIKQAKQKETTGKVDFRVGDMLAIADTFAHGSFHAITCLGNTLVHLDGPGQIGSFFHSANQLLATQGKLLIQVLNYKSILESHTSNLPTIENSILRFERGYIFLPGGSIDFCTRLYLKGTQQVIENKVTLYPATQNELLSLLEENGFTNCCFFGGFDKSPVDKDRLPLVIIASKK